MNVAVDSLDNVYVSQQYCCCNHIQKFGYGNNTPVGPYADYEDSADGVKITFEDVTSAGKTTVIKTEGGPQPPSGFFVWPITTYYEIETTATFTGDIKICIEYDPTGLPVSEEELFLIQYDSNWDFITTNRYPDDDTICGVTTHFCYFAIVYQDVIQAVVEINPNTFNLKSKGNYITCYIELDDEYDVNDIDQTQDIVLEYNGNSVIAEESPREIDDYDNDGILDLMVKFDRQIVYEIIDTGDIELTVTGSILDGPGFEGTDFVYVKDVGKDHTDEADASSVEY